MGTATDNAANGGRVILEGLDAEFGWKARDMGRFTGRLLAAVALGAVGYAVRGVPAALGRRPSGAALERVRRSPRYRDGAFHNIAPTTTMASPGTMRDALRDMLFGGQRRRPAGPVPLVRPDRHIGGDGPFLTWFGHASTLVELDGAAVLLDPVWGERVSPSTLVGPRRLHPNPVELTDLPQLAAILISHDHYDHLDLPTVRTLLRTQSAPFVVPIGVGAHLRRWRVPAARIIELDWSESTTIGELRLTATAAQHFSGRGLRRDGTLWTSWVLAGPRHRVFYTGDSGYFPGYASIGAEYGPFDATLIQIGAYHHAWPDIHMTPEQGVAAHLDLRGGVLVPVHWATFSLAPHAWTEPADRVWREAKARDVTLAVPRPGERIDVADPPSVDGWWQTLG